MGLQSGDLAGYSVWVTLPCWRKSRTTRAWWRYRLGSSSYPRNAAWQMVLRCFAKCPCRAHHWGISRGVQETIWHHCEKHPRHVPKHHQLGPCKPDTFAGSAHQVSDIPKASHLPLELESALVTEDDTLPMGHYLVLPPMVLLQEKTAVISSQQELPWVYMHGNHRTRAGCWWFSSQLSFHTNSSSTLSRPEHLWSDPVGPSWTKHVLDEVCSSEDPRGLAMQQSSSGSMPLEGVVDGSTSQAHMTSNITSPRALTGQCKHLMSNIYRGWWGIIRTISENWETICNCWFELATVWR